MLQPSELALDCGMTAVEGAEPFRDELDARVPLRDQLVRASRHVEPC
jgi:hypothetical protein